MQNEITELRNQVRTLKRIVYLVCCLFGVFLCIGCSSLGANMDSGGTDTSDNTDESVLILDASGTPLYEPYQGELYCAHPHHTVLECAGLKALLSPELLTPEEKEESCCQHPHHLVCVVNTGKGRLPLKVFSTTTK